MNTGSHQKRAQRGQRVARAGVARAGVARAEVARAEVARTRVARTGEPVERICETRRGFSLIEVMIATAILMGSAIVLSKLAGMGREQSVRARLYAEAQQRCEQLQQEMLLELRPLAVKSGEPLIPGTADRLSEIPADGISDGTAASLANADAELPSPDGIPPESGPDAQGDELHPAWRYSVSVDPLAEAPGMWCLTVSVFQGDRTLRRPVRAELTRWILSAGPPVLSGDGDHFPSGLPETLPMPSDFTAADGP